MEDEDDDRLVLTRELGGDEVLLRGSVRRAGRRWTLEANSVERLRELQRLFCEVVPDAVHVSESSRSADEVAAEHRDAGPAHPAATGLTQEQEAEALRRHLLDYEERWLDMELPGLGGRTPRGAVAEGGPALAELQAMLDDMAWMRRQMGDAGGGGMDAGRLRQLLGL